MLMPLFYELTFRVSPPGSPAETRIVGKYYEYNGTYICYFETIGNIITRQSIDKCGGTSVNYPLH